MSAWYGGILPRNEGHILVPRTNEIRTLAEAIMPCALTSESFALISTIAPSQFRMNMSIRVVVERAVGLRSYSWASDVLMINSNCRGRQPCRTSAKHVSMVINRVACRAPQHTRRELKNDPVQASAGANEYPEKLGSY